MARSSWKFYFKSTYLLKRTYLAKFSKSRYSGAYYRSSTITKSDYKKRMFVHKGNMFVKILINKYQIGHKFGEFAFTRKPFSFTKKKKKKNAISKR